MNEDEHFPCPTCFTNIAELRGFVGRWRLTFERTGSPLAQGVPKDEAKVVDRMLDRDLGGDDKCEDCGRPRDAHSRHFREEEGACRQFVGNFIG
jgi:hypothetical protein